MSYSFHFCLWKKITNSLASLGTLLNAAQVADNLLGITIYLPVFIAAHVT
jgi:hypothetical protein